MIPRRFVVGISLLLGLAGIVTVISAAPSKQLPLEHVYCDPLKEGELASAHGTPSMVAKAKCKGVGCPPLDGKVVVIEGCRWESVNGIQVFVEETSGWYFFFRNAERTIPLRPTNDELSNLYNGEKGYLKNQCGYLRYTS